ncbi:hypothetical protein [Brevundimonas sp.]|uniref:hypothetical protein n=1 Tax=Brevundimonas sp. TaxID=1871086 RepID=UPI0037BF6E25
MSRIGFAGLLTLAVSATGCASLQRFDQAAADLAARSEATCTPEPALGLTDFTGPSCRVSQTFYSKTVTTTTVEEAGQAPVTTRTATVTTPSGTRTEVVPTP